MTNNNWEEEFDNRFEIQVMLVNQKTPGLIVTRPSFRANEEMKDFISSLLTKKENQGYERGIADKNVWNGVYHIGAIEEREKCNQEHKAELEMIKRDIKNIEWFTWEDVDDVNKRAISILDSHINKLSTE